MNEKYDMSEHQNIENKQSWHDEYLKWIGSVAFSKSELFMKTINS